MRTVCKSIFKKGDGTSMGGGYRYANILVFIKRGARTHPRLYSLYYAVASIIFVCFYVSPQVMYMLENLPSIRLRHNHYFFLPVNIIHLCIVSMSTFMPWGKAGGCMHRIPHRLDY
jgi:hypothetical protein